MAGVGETRLKIHPGNARASGLDSEPMKNSSPHGGSLEGEKTEVVLHDNFVIRFSNTCLHARWLWQLGTWAPRHAGKYREWIGGHPFR